MQLAIDQKDIDKFLMIGDKVLIKPKNPQSQTKTGLYLPPTVQQGEKIQAGYVIKAGPGYPLPVRWGRKRQWRRCATGLCKLVRACWASTCKTQLMRLPSTRNAI